jgi:hypothetical protein
MEKLCLRDRDHIYGTIVTRRLRAMGIRDKPIAPASPWQNSFAERLIGSIWRECKTISSSWARLTCTGSCKLMPDITTRSERTGHLDKDAPVSRPVQRIATIKSLALLGGLHHHYVRI